MLRQEGIAFLKATTTLSLSPLIFRELKLAMYRQKKLPVLPGSRGTTSRGGARAPQRSSCQLAGKRKAN
jgi:hypothetical protein